MNHHGRRLAGHAVIALSHGNGDIFVGHGDKVRNFFAGLGGAHQALDNRRKIGPCIGKYIVNAAVHKGRQKHLRHAHLIFDGFNCSVHYRLPRLICLMFPSILREGIPLAPAFQRVPSGRARKCSFGGAMIARPLS